MTSLRCPATYWYTLHGPRLSSPPPAPRRGSHRPQYPVSPCPSLSTALTLWPCDPPVAYQPPLPFPMPAGPAPGPLSAKVLNSRTKVACGQGTVYPKPTQVHSASSTGLTLTISKDLIFYSTLSIVAPPLTLLQRNLNRTIWKDLISTICLRLQYLNVRPTLVISEKVIFNKLCLWLRLSFIMTEPEPQHNTGTDIEQPFVYSCVSVCFITTESELRHIEGTDIA